MEPSCLPRFTYPPTLDPKPLVPGTRTQSQDDSLSFPPRSRSLPQPLNVPPPTPFFSTQVGTRPGSSLDSSPEWQRHSVVAPAQHVRRLPARREAVAGWCRWRPGGPGSGPGQGGWSGTEGNGIVAGSKVVGVESSGP